MKMTTGILGCALATGLMTFASSNAQAGGIGIDGNLYAPLTIKAKITYVEDDKFKTMSYGNKDILAAADIDVKGMQLTLGSDEDVYAVIKESGDYEVVANMTDDGRNGTYVEVDLDEYISTYKENESNNNYKEESQGQGEVSLYSWSYVTGDSGAYDEVDLYGNYSDKYTYSENSKGYKESYSMNAKTLAGESYSWDGDSYSDSMPASGSVSAKGNAKFDWIE